MSASRSIDIVTCFDKERRVEFEQVKRKKRGKWSLLVSGEYCPTMFGGGYNSHFQIASTKDQKYWAILSVRFPKRIIATGKVNCDLPLEEIAGRMLRAVRTKGGESIDSAHEFGDIVSDPELFWKHYYLED